MSYLTNKFAKFGIRNFDGSTKIVPRSFNNLGTRPRIAKKKYILMARKTLATICGSRIFYFWPRAQYFLHLFHFLPYLVRHVTLVDIYLRILQCCEASVWFISIPWARPWGLIGFLHLIVHDVFSLTVVAIIVDASSLTFHLFLRAIATHGSTSLFSLNLLKKPYNRR